MPITAKTGTCLSLYHSYYWVYLGYVNAVIAGNSLYFYDYLCNSANCLFLRLNMIIVFLFYRDCMELCL